MAGSLKEKQISVYNAVKTIPPHKKDKYVLFIVLQIKKDMAKAIVATNIYSKMSDNCFM